MDIHKLEVFISLVETANYTRTAKALHMTQPAVTHDIKSIENEIGVRLFNRNKRSVNITPNGKAFYLKVKTIINNYYSAVQDIQKNSLEENSKIVIGYSYTPFNDMYVPQWINKFQRQNPATKFSIISLNHNELKQHLLSNEIDIILTTGNATKDLENIKTYTLETESFKAIIPRNHPLSKKRILTLSDFQNQKMLYLDNNWAASDLIHLQDKLRYVNRDINITYANNLSSLNVLIKGQQGIALGLFCLYLFISL